MGDEELLWVAVGEAVAPIAHLERQWEQEKLEKKLRDYFKKAAKGLQFGSKPWDVLVNDYTDAVFSSIFCGLGDRDWLPQADFLLCVDAGIKDFFPVRVFNGVPQQIFECKVLQATDRAFDEQRYWMLRWDTIQRIVAGKGTQKRVREALDTARADTVQEEPENVEEFVGGWVTRTVDLLARHAQGDPENCLPESVALQLFQALLQEGGLPWKLVSAEGLPPPDWPGVISMVQQAYSKHASGAPVESSNHSGNAPATSNHAAITPGALNHIGSAQGTFATKGGDGNTAPWAGGRDAFEAGKVGGKAMGKSGCWGKAVQPWAQGWEGWEGWQSWGWGESVQQWPEEQGFEEPAAKRWKGGW